MYYSVKKIKEDILADNIEKAIKLRDYLKERKIFLLNVMSSPGSGKTTLLSHVINRLKDKYSIGVIEADIDGEEDARTIAERTGVKTMQIQTMGTCHLTAQMVTEAVEHFNPEGIDLLIIENIGNLVCPAEFDTGSDLNLVLLSVPEGDDKPLKYPLMFEVAHLVAITKLDVAPVFDFDKDTAVKNIHYRNKDVEIFFTSKNDEASYDALVNKLDEVVSRKIK